MKNKKKKREREASYTSATSDYILNSPTATLIAGLASIALGLFFTLFVGVYEPISRQEAVFYAGQFEDCDYIDDTYYIDFKDGTTHSINLWSNSDFDDDMDNLKKGERLELLLHPDTEDVLEIRTKNKVLTPFDETQKNVINDNRGFQILGVCVAVGGIFLICFAVAMKKNCTAEKEKHHKRYKGAKLNENTPRKADLSKRARILLETETKDFKICYRRLKSTNELIVNGYIYDTKKAVMEFEHSLFASVGGHKIEAGLDEQSYSYIKLDGEILAEKRRMI